MAARFVLQKSGSFYFFRLQRIKDGEPILTGELYLKKEDATDGIQAVRASAPLRTRYQRKTSVGGEYYFVLVGRRGEPIGLSELYPTDVMRDATIAFVKLTAAHAPVHGET